MELCAWLLMACALCSCQSFAIAVPPIERSGLESHVRAWEVADAERVAQSMEELVPRVRRIKDVAKPAPLVLMSREHLPGITVGVQMPSFVVLDPDTRRSENFCLAHELSHWFRDEVWHRLPHSMEEGLADHVASLLVPAGASSRFYWYVSSTPEVVDLDTFRATCSVTDVEAHYQTPEEELRMRGIGYAAASAIGVYVLRELCERARSAGLSSVPAEWIYDALPFPGNEPGSWRAAIRRRLNELDNEAARGRQVSGSA